MDKNMEILNIGEAIELNSKPYLTYIVLERAIPSIDGLKPSQRRIIYTMYKMGLLDTANKIVNKTKSSNVVGQVMKLHPHGDSYETIVNLTTGNERLNIPFVESKGNFSKTYLRDTAPAAHRYTEIKLDAINKEIFKSIDKNVVEFVDNYDDYIGNILFTNVFDIILTYCDSFILKDEIIKKTNSIIFKIEEIDNVWFPDSTSQDNYLYKQLSKLFVYGFAAKKHKITDIQKKIKEIIDKMAKLKKNETQEQMSTYELFNNNILVNSIVAND